MLPTDFFFFSLNAYRTDWTYHMHTQKLGTNSSLLFSLSLSFFIYTKRTKWELLVAKKNLLICLVKVVIARINQIKKLIFLFITTVELSHFLLLRSVGKGSFGKVRVVQHKGTKKLYALKYINKEKCIQMKAVDNIISERRLLERIDYNLIVNMRYAFQDDENLFMVLDLMLGGDLRFHLERLGTLPEDYVRFYAAELALSLNYLHSKQIIHRYITHIMYIYIYIYLLTYNAFRDIKPDNILLDEKGHAHLTDFNIAAQLGNKKNKSLTSIAGSMAYIAPEILKKQGYSYSVDWWSLGILLYELLYGKVVVKLVKLSPIYKKERSFIETLSRKIK